MTAERCHTVLARLFINNYCKELTYLCQWSVAIRSVVSAVDVSQGSSPCDERVDADDNSTGWHTTKRDD